MTPAVIITLVICCMVVGLALIARWFPWDKLQKPVQETDSAVKQRLDKLEMALNDALDKHEQHRRTQDNELYELKQHMRVVSREQEDGRERFETQLREVQAERSKLSQMATQQRGPFGMR